MLKMKRILGFTLLVFAVALSIKYFVFSSEKPVKSNDKEYAETSRRFYKIFSVPVPEQVEFANEKVPLHIFYVKEALEKELLVNTYWQSSSILILKRTGRYFPVIDSVLKANTIPEDFKYLALVESGLEYTVSPAGATGIWQFMKSTGTQYGLTINDEIDERNNLIKSTVAACKYFKNAHDLFNNWTLAAASYNMGILGVSEALKNQKTDSYYSLYLNKETQRYVYRILALKIIYNSPVVHGFYLRNSDIYRPVKTYSVAVDSAVANWPDFAIKNNSDYRTLKELNPWILKYTLTNKDRKKYQILFPVKSNGLNNEKSDDNTLFNDTLTVEQIH